jgi:hypothetical protein
MSTQSIPAEVWLNIIVFLPSKDVINCSSLDKSLHDLVFNVHHAHPYIHGQQQLWRQLCHSVFADTSIADRERRINRASKKQKEKVQLFSSDSRSKKMFDTYKFDFVDITQPIPHEYSADHIISSSYSGSFLWREMFLHMLQRFDEWKDKSIIRTKVKKSRKDEYSKYTDIKPLPEVDVIRLVVCGIPTSNKHLFVNKLIHSLGADHDMYDIALSGIQQVIRLSNVKIINNYRDNNIWRDNKAVETEAVLPQLLLYIADCPYHYAKQWKGTGQVSGVIYVVDTLRFPQNYDKIYRDFHDTIGEYVIFSYIIFWFVCTDAEHFDLSLKPDDWNTPYFNTRNSESYLVFQSNPNDVVKAIMHVLRCDALLTCEWYLNAHCTIGDTLSENMERLFPLFVGCVSDYLNTIRKKGESYGVYYPYLSDEDDRTESEKSNIFLSFLNLFKK